MKSIGGLHDLPSVVNPPGFENEEKEDDDGKYKMAQAREHP